MTALVTKNLPLVAGAPDGVKKLRALILELAVRGRLLPTARQPNTEVPVAWIHTKLGSMLSFEYGDNLPAAKRSNTGEYPVYGSNGIVGTHNDCFVQHPCIVIGRKGSAGALNLCTSPGCCVTDVAYYCIPPQSMSLEYAFKLLHTLGLDTLGKGIKPGLNRNEAYSLDILVPPLAEQHRIVAKVDELMALCDRLEADQADAETAHVQLVQVLLDSLTQATDAADFRASWQRLSGHFHTLFTTEASIDALKQTVLQLAVMGKLAPQSLDDEPAEMLLKRIQEQKQRLVAAGVLRKQRQLPEVDGVSVPFELSNGWTWVRWESVTWKIGDIDHKMPETTADGVPFVSPRDFYPGNVIDFDGAKRVSHEDYERLSAKIKAERGDLIYPRYGTIGENVIVDVDRDFLVSYSCAVIKVANGFIDPMYQFYCSLSACVRRQAKAAENKTTQANVGIKSIQEFLFPLPPVAEQHRIVAKVDELMALCDQLKAQLAEARQQHGQLATELVAQAVAA